MVPDVAGIGHSFRGALSYYLHDKRADEQSPHPETSARVSWTETRNLATADMQTAERIMLATARQADELKRAAGIKATGRKSNAHVYAYSLAWHPSEAKGLTRAEMVRAADASLRTLGAGEQQAVIVCHTDRQHPHVHVIVNRVHPEDGRMFSISNDRLRLSEWANTYERERNNIVTPKREERRQQREQHPDREKRREYAKQKLVAAKERAHARENQVESLRQLGAANRVKAKEQWQLLSLRNRISRTEIHQIARVKIETATERHKTECKPVWAKHFEKARVSRRDWERRDKRLAGRLGNAVDAARHERATGQLVGKGMTSAVARNFFSNAARERAFNEAQELTRGELSKRLKAILDVELRQIRDERRDLLHLQKNSFTNERQKIIAEQTQARDQLRRAWAGLQPERQPDGRKPYRRKDMDQSRDQNRDQERQPESFFARKERLEQQTPLPQRESFFVRKERLEREQKQEPRSRNQDRDR